jgi:hypothetical protein
LITEVLSKRLRIKDICRTLDEQERHLILGMLSLEIKGKDLTTKAQQDLTVNVAINN